MINQLSNRTAESREAVDLFNEERKKRMYNTFLHQRSASKAFLHTIWTDWFADRRPDSLTGQIVCGWFDGSLTLQREDWHAGGDGVRCKQLKRLMFVLQPMCKSQVPGGVTVAFDTFGYLGFLNVEPTDRHTRTYVIPSMFMVHIFCGLTAIHARIFPSV